MQPVWRIKDGEGELQRHDVPDESWPEIMKGGGNGFFLVLISLSWWMEAAKEKTDKDDCLSVVDDVMWVLEQMVARLEELDGSGSGEEDAARYSKRCVVFPFRCPRLPIGSFHDQTANLLRTL